MLTLFVDRLVVIVVGGVGGRVVGGLVGGLVGGVVGFEQDTLLQHSPGTFTSWQFVGKFSYLIHLK